MPCTQLHNTSPHHWTPVLHPLIFPALAAALVLALLAWPLRTLLRRRQLRQQPFPAAWREILRQRQARVERLHPGGIGYIARKLARRMDVRQGGPE